jgi:hypothetical protein
MDMATVKTPADRAFNEVVFQGKPKVVRAFLSGLLLGAGRRSTVYFSFLDGVQHEGKAAKLAELIGLRGSDCYVIIDVETAIWLKGLARAIADETGLIITANRRIRSASMALSYHVCARRYDDEIMAALNNLPAGLKLTGFRRDVRVDPDANGVEAYAPAHEFEATGKGAITGPVDLVIELKRNLARFPLLQTVDIELKVG